MFIRQLSDLPIESVSHNPEIKKKVFVKKSEVLNITQIAEITFLPGQIADRHKHMDMYEIFMVQSGKGEFLIDEKITIGEAGSCVVVSPGEMHEVKNSGGEVMKVIVIGIEVVNKNRVG